MIWLGEKPKCELDLLSPRNLGKSPVDVERRALRIIKLQNTDYIKYYRQCGATATVGVPCWQNVLVAKTV